MKLKCVQKLANSFSKIGPVLKLTRPMQFLTLADKRSMINTVNAEVLKGFQLTVITARVTLLSYTVPLGVSSNLICNSDAYYFIFMLSKSSNLWSAIDHI